MNYFILISYFLVLILIGFIHSGKQQTLSDYFLAGRSIPTWAAMAAIVGAETSSVTFIGTPAMSFAKGGDFSFLQFALGLVLARILLALFFLPKFFDHEIVTIYEYLGRHFGKSVQYVSGQFFFVTRALASGVRHYAAALVITTITGIDIITAIAVTGFVSLAYSFMGGLSAVIWTEVLQFGVMIVGSILAFFLILGQVPGGMSEIWQTALDNGKLTMIHWDWSGTGSFSLFAGIFSGCCLCLATHGADQDIVQRLLSCKNLRSARIAIIGSGFFVFAQFAFFLFIGVGLFTVYKELPQGLTKNDEIFPYFIMHGMNPIAGTIVIASILSAALSSTASALNALASTAVQDYVSVFFKQRPSDNYLVWLSRAITVVWMIILMFIAFIAKNSDSILQTGLAIPSITYGSLLAAFLLGIFTAVRKQSAVITGMLTGLFVVLILKFYGFHWTWFVPSGTIISMATAWILDYRGVKKCQEN